MKKTYQTVLIELVSFNVEEVLTTSTVDGEENIFAMPWEQGGGQ